MRRHAIDAKRQRLQISMTLLVDCEFPLVVPALAYNGNRGARRQPIWIGDRKAKLAAVLLRSPMGRDKRSH